MKTTIARVRLNQKSFAPKELSGYIGAARRPLHPSHKLAAARGVVWCWNCGQIAIVKPIGLTKVCEPPTAFSRAALRRLRDGKPPFGLKRWPDGDDTVYRKLVVAQTNDIWGSSTGPAAPAAPGSARL